MVSEEIKDTVYLAIGCIVVALLLGFCAFILQARREFTATYNQQVSVDREMAAYIDYAEYNDKIVYGIELMSIIRNFWDSDTPICIDEMIFKDSNGKAISVPYEGFVQTIPDKNGNPLEISDCVTVGGDKWIYLNGDNRREISSHITELSEYSNAFTYTIIDLQLGREDVRLKINNKETYGLDANEAYYVYLVENTNNPEDIINAKFTDTFSSYTDITAIKIRHIPKEESSFEKPEDEDRYYRDVDMGIEMIRPWAVNRDKFRN